MRGLGLVAWVCVGLVGAASTRAQDEPAPDAGSLPELFDSAVVRLASAARSQGLQALERKQFPQALASFNTAHELEPRDAEVTLRLAQLHQTLGHDARAEALYRELIVLAPEQTDAYLALGDLLARDKTTPARLAAASELYAQAQDRLGSDASLLLRKARVEHARGFSADAERDYTRYLADHRPDDGLALELGDFYRDLERPDDALGYYKQVSDGALGRVAAQRMFELDVGREARRYGLSQRAADASAQARAAEQKARMLAAQGKLTAAEATLRAALTRSPGLAELRSQLADVLREAGNQDQAELEYLRAIALDGSQPEVFMRLSELYLASQPARAAEAAWLLERALLVRPEWARAEMLLVGAYRELGNLPQALVHASRYANQTVGGPEHEAALALQVSLQAGLGLDRQGGQAASAPALSGADRLARARAFVARGSTDAALAELRRLEESPLQAEVFELQARILYAAGRSIEAARVLSRSLARDPAQPQARSLLGEILWSLGQHEPAREQLETCAQDGLIACSYRLAKLETEATSGAWSDLVHVRTLLSARSRLERLSGEALPVSAHELSRVRAELDRRLWVALAMWLGVCLIAGLIAAAGWRARWGGIGLQTLLSRHPQAAPDVQRVLSAIRHEVLKHNTLMLAGVTEALQRGDHTSDAAKHMAHALFGEDGDTGASKRFAGYVDKLVQIGRSYGERLNLLRRDPALSALTSGLAAVRALREQLLEAAQLSAAGRQRLAKRLRRANTQLNVRGQAELNTLLEGLRSLQLTAPALSALFERTRREPGLASEPIAALQIAPRSELPCSIAMPGLAFEDVVCNLFRNAMQASLRYPEPRPVVVGVDVRREVDDVTGLSSIVLRVFDRAPDALDPHKLRGGYIEAGLGLTADLVARHEGQLAVEPGQSGFSKAVVLRLPAQLSDAP